MPKILEVALLVVIPVVWGLAIHSVFELFRRRRSAARPQVPDIDPEADAS